jgi:hypothetical protein
MQTNEKKHMTSLYRKILSFIISLPANKQKHTSPLCATGKYLDNWACYYGLSRKTESDSDLRARLMQKIINPLNHSLETKNKNMENNK